MRKNGSTLFLLEFIIAIFFFTLACAVCIRLFVGSHLTAEDNIAKTHAVLWTENIAEIYSGTDGSLEAIEDVLLDKEPALQGKASIITDSALKLYFDQAWNLCDEATAIYRLEARETNSGLQISATQIEKNTTVYELQCSHL